MLSRMCGRYTLTNQDDVIRDLQVAIDLTAGSEWWKPRYNVAPTQPAPVITLTEDGARIVEMMRWGFVPFWGAKDGAKPPLMINARAENLLANHGRGIFLMKQLMDEVDFKFDRGTEVHLHRQRRWLE